MSQVNTTRGLIVWFIKNPIAANLLMMIIIVLGVMSLSTIKLESFPTSPPAIITINIAHPGSTPQEVEQGIVVKIEQALSSVQGIKSIWSLVESSGATITIEKKQFKDINSLLQAIKTKINDIPDLPNTEKLPVIAIEKEERSVVWLSIFGDVPEAILLQNANALKNQLRKKPNISQVYLSGAQDTEIAVLVPNEKLQQYDLTFSDIADLLKSNDFDASIGSLQTTNNKKLPMSIDKGAHLSTELGNTVIQQGALGDSLYLRDIAKINQAYAKNVKLSLYNGEPALLLKIQADGDTDYIEAYREVETTIKNFQTTADPSVQLELWHNNTKEVSDRLAFFVQSGFFSMVLVFLSLAIFLDLKLALWVSVGIPISFAGALILMPTAWFGLSLNIVTLFAFIMVLGIVVDDAIIIGESIYNAKQSSDDAHVATIQGINKIAIPATFGVLTTIAAFWPLTRINSDMGQILGQIGWVVVFCLLFSLVESKLILPTHLKNITVNRDENSTSLWSKLQALVHFQLTAINKKIFQPLLSLSLRYRYLTLLLFISMLVASVGLLYKESVNSIFFPDLEEEFIDVNFGVEENMSIDDIEKKARHAAFKLNELNYSLLDHGEEQEPPIKNIYISASKSGISIVAELQGITHRNTSVEQLKKMWREELNTESDFEFNQFDDESDDIYIELYGQNSIRIRQATLKLSRQLQAYKQINQVDSSEDNREKVLQVSVNSEGKARGFSNKLLARKISPAFNGESIKRTYINGNEAEIVLYFENADKNNINDLKNFLVKNDKGIISVLGSIANVCYANQPKFIERLNGERTGWVSAGIDKSLYSPNKVINDLENNGLLDLLKEQYPDIRFNFGGEYEEEDVAIQSLIIAFCVSILLIYIFLAIPLKSYGKPLVILSIVPFSFVGVILGHLVIDIPISLLSFFGFLALSGVVVNDSLILLTTIYCSSSDTSLWSRLMSAASERFRAIVLTSLTTFICLTPIIFTESYQLQLFVPTAVSLGFGVIFSTITTLILVPVICLIVDDLRTCFLYLRKHGLSTLN